MLRKLFSIPIIFSVHCTPPTESELETEVIKNGIFFHYELEISENTCGENMRQNFESDGPEQHFMSIQHAENTIALQQQHLEHEFICTLSNQTFTCPETRITHGSSPIDNGISFSGTFTKPTEGTIELLTYLYCQEGEEERCSQVIENESAPLTCAFHRTGNATYCGTDWDDISEECENLVFDIRLEHEELEDDFEEEDNGE